MLVIVRAYLRMLVLVWVSVRGPLLVRLYKNVCDCASVFTCVGLRVLLFVCLYKICAIVRAYESVGVGVGVCCLLLFVCLFKNVIVRACESVGVCACASICHSLFKMCYRASVRKCVGVSVCGCASICLSL